MEVIALIGAIVFVFVGICLFALMKISGEESRWEEYYRDKKKGKNNEKTKS